MSDKLAHKVIVAQKGGLHDYPLLEMALILKEHNLHNVVTIDEGSTTLYVNMDMQAWCSARRPTEEQVRAYKKLFGPFNVTGKAPWVGLERDFMLENPTTGDNIGVGTARLSGAFECKVISTEKAIKVIPAVQAEPERTEEVEVHSYSCVPYDPSDLS